MEVINRSAAKPFVTKDGSIIREILAHRNSGIRNQSLAEATVPPGATTLAHYHPVSEEIYYILSGSGIMRICDDEREVIAGDGVAIPPGAVHAIYNPGAADLVLLCCCAPGYEHADTIIVDAPADR